MLDPGALIRARMFEMQRRSLEAMAVSVRRAVYLRDSTSARKVIFVAIMYQRVHLPVLTDRLTTCCAFGTLLSLLTYFQVLDAERLLLNVAVHQGQTDVNTRIQTIEDLEKDLFDLKYDNGELNC